MGGGHYVLKPTTIPYLCLSFSALKIQKRKKIRGFFIAGENPRNLKKNSWISVAGENPRKYLNPGG